MFYWKLINFYWTERKRDLKWLSKAFYVWTEIHFTISDIIILVSVNINCQNLRDEIFSHKRDFFSVLWTNKTFYLSLSSFKNFYFHLKNLTWNFFPKITYFLKFRNCILKINIDKHLIFKSNILLCIPIHKFVQQTLHKWNYTKSAKREN